MIAPPRTLRSVRVVDAGTTNGSGSQGHAVGHLGVRGGSESPLCVSSGTVEPTVDHEEGAIRKTDELAHGARLQHVVVLHPSGARSVLWLRGYALTIAGSGDQPSIDEGPGVVTPVILGHVATTAEDDSGGVVVLRSQREHGNTSGGRVDSNDTSGHVGETSFLEGIWVPQHSGYVGLEEHLPRGHHEGVSVGVETRSVDHELHLLGRARGWEELDGRLGSTSFCSGICVGIVPVDVASVDETTDQSDGTIGEGLSGRVPTRFLHLQNVGIFPPSALGVGDEVGIGTSARVENSNGTSAVVILVSRVVRG